MDEEIVKDIKRLLNKLTRAKHSKDHDILFYDILVVESLLYVLYGITDQVDVKSYRKHLSLQKIVDQKWQFVNRIDEDIDTHLSISTEMLKYASSHDVRIFDKTSPKVYTQNDALDIIIAFFNELDPSLLEMIRNDVILQGNNFPPGIIAQTFHISSLQKSYILNKCDMYSIHDLTYLAHEFAHSIESILCARYRTKNYSEKYRSYYEEFFSTYIERLFLEFIREHGVSYPEYINAKARKNYNMLCHFKELLYVFFMINDKVLLNGEDLEDVERVEEILRYLHDITGFDFTTPIPNPNIKKGIIYSYGNLFALYMLNKDEPKEAMKKIFSMIAANSYIQGFDALDLLGIDLSDLSIPQEDIRKTDEAFKKTFYLQ